MERHQPGKLRLRVAQSVAQWIGDHLDNARRDALARASGLDPAALEAGTAWASTAEVVAFLHAAEQEIGEERFLEACRYRLADTYGPLRYIFWALTPAQVYRRAAQNMHLVSSHGHYTIVDEKPNYQRWRYESNDPDEARCLCLVRQANAEVMPTLWGLPPARVEERGCVAHGDNCCEYEISWAKETKRWPSLVGAAAGGALAVALLASGVAHWSLAVALILIGLLVGQVFALRVQRRATNAFVRESHSAIERIARDEATAREQLLVMGQRQDEWTRLMEQQLGHRNAALEKVVSTVRDLQEQRVVALRGYSHDLRSPLTVIRMIAEMMIVKAARGEAIADPGSLDDLKQAVDQMDVLLSELMKTALEETSAPTLASETIIVEELAARIRGELRALVFGKEIRVSVFCTREAPREVQTDRLHFARIIDNLLSNAAKYTEEGSIVVELDGPPDYLVLKISDSGRGIAEDALSKVFQPQGSEASERALASYGLGLSVVVRLLAQLGGRLEVMSRVGVGTTFWVYLPQEQQQEHEATPIAKVVTIRRAE